MPPSNPATDASAGTGHADPSAPTAAVDALPVSLCLAGPSEGPVRRWVEGVAGWQPVDPATGVLVPPALTITDVAGSEDVRADAPPVILVVGEEAPEVAARAAVSARAVEVIRWPEGAQQLVAVAGRLAWRRRHPARDAHEMRVAGAAGGVGTTTIALALGGLLAWRGAHALVAARGHVPVPNVTTLAAGDHDGAPVWRAAASAPGVPRLRVVRVARSGSTAGIDSGPAGVLVHDLGVAVDADVLVVRRDRAGVEALGGTGAAVAVVIDSGPASLRSLRAAAPHRRLLLLPFSARVARAGLALRVPAALPGSWLRTLATILAGGTA